MKEYKISGEKEEEIKKGLESRNDAEALRIKRYLSMPDLSRTEGSPIKELVKRIESISDFKDFDIIEVPEITPTNIAFDLFDFPPDHPARSKSDTYYINQNNILRTQTTTMWHYYLNLPDIKERLEKKEPIGVFSYCKIYSKN